MTRPVSPPRSRNCRFIAGSLALKASTANALRLDPRRPDHGAAIPSVVGGKERGPVDAVLTSPPYGDRLGIAHRGGLSPYVRKLLLEGKTRLGFVPGIYGPGRENIGNLKG